MDSMTIKKVMFSFGTLLSLLLTLPSTQAAWNPHEDFQLFSAGEFAVLSLGKPSAETDGQSKLDLSQVTIHGDVGVGPYGTLDFQGPSEIYGNLYLDSTLQNILTDEGYVDGSRIEVEDQFLAVAVADALHAAEHNAALEPTQAFDRITAAKTIYGDGGLNVITIEGIDYSKSSLATPLTLTLNGGGADLFVLNVSGKFVLGPRSSIRGGGDVDPSRILINIKQGNTPVQFATDSYVGGTLLSPYRKMGPLQGFSGPVIGARVQEISLVGGAEVNPLPPSLNPTAVIVAPDTVSVGQTVQLDGSASNAPSGEPLSYAWQLLTVPTGSGAALLPDRFVADPQFYADAVGEYGVQLIVSDGTYESLPAEMAIVARDPTGLVDLALEITDSPDPVYKKGTLIYTLTVENKSTITATNVVLTASLVGDVRGTPSVDPMTDPSDQCVYTLESGVTCLMGELPAYQSATVQVVVVPKRAGFFALDGYVSSEIPDLNDRDNGDVEQTEVLQ